MPVEASPLRTPKKVLDLEDMVMKKFVVTFITVLVRAVCGKSYRD